MASWQLAPSLVRLRNEVDGRWPRRDTRSDGDLGDAAHRTTSSDHNPSNGYVHAWDVDKDGVDVNAIVRAAIAHPSTNYVIYARTIWTSQSGFRARAYTGSNPHTLHAHISVARTSTGRFSTRRWLGAAQAPVPVDYTRHVHSMPTFRKGDPHNVYVRDLQGHLNYWRTLRGESRLVPDGWFGPSTDYVVRLFQMGHGLAGDGIVGPNTWAKLHQVCGYRRLESDGRGF